ncbi:MAG TPA: galactokinase family protein [Vicinamibacterales bacterium]|jgi:galactokinase
MSIHDPDDRRVADALERAGFGGALAQTTAARLTALGEELRHQRGAVASDAWFVPGRIEVLGKHTDYAGGRSLVCAVERGIAAVSAARDDGRLTVTDTRRQASVVLDQASPASTTWTTYPATVFTRLRRNFPDRIRGADVVFESDLPSASGMSSSSAVMIVVLLALAHASRLDASPEWAANIENDEDLAAYAATIENGSAFRNLASESGVGTRGGSEDHTAILCSRPGRLAQYSYRPTRHERSIALPPELVLAIGVSGVRAQKTGNAREGYNRAAHGIERILELWRRTSGRRDETLADAISSAPGAAARIRALVAHDEPRLVDRFDHFVEESMVLVPLAGDQLEQGALDAFGPSVDRSQDLAERLLGNQVPETISLARLARERGAIAASAFGAGFGGSAWALVERGDADDFLARWQKAYARAHPGPASRSIFFFTRPGPAALRISA